MRELENLIKRLCVLVSGPIILPEHIDKFGELEINADADGAQSFETLDEINQRHENELRALILKTYQVCDYNLSETARKLKVARTSLRSQCQALGIWDSMDVVGKKDQASSKSEIKRLLDNSVRMVMNAVREA